MSNYLGMIPALNGIVGVRSSSVYDLGNCVFSVDVYLNVPTSPLLEKEIAQTIYSYTPLGALSQGITSCNVFCTEVSFNLLEPESEEGMACLDKECKGSLDLDFSNCTCYGDNGPCSNCEDGLNLTCTECSGELQDLKEDLRVKSLRGSGRTTKQIENLKEGGVFVVSHDIKDLLYKMGRLDVIVLKHWDLSRYLRETKWSSIKDIAIDHCIQEQGTMLITQGTLDRVASLKATLKSVEKSFTASEVKQRGVSKSLKEYCTYTKINGYNHDFMLLEDVFAVDTNNNLGNTTNHTQKEQLKMTTLNRKQVEVTLIDNDSSLPAEKAIVFSTKIISDGSKEDIIREVIFSGAISKALDTHNTLRKGIVDEGILERVGNEVKLRAVELKDLTWNIN